VDAEQPPGLSLGLTIDDAVGRDLLARHLLHRDDRPPVALEDVDHLAHAGRGPVDDVVPEHDRERLVPHEVPGHEDRVAETELLPLPHVGGVDHVRDRADLLEHLRLSPLLEKALELVGDVEVVLDGVLALPGDDDDAAQARGHRPLDHVLHDRLVDVRPASPWAGP